MRKYIIIIICIFLISINIFSNDKNEIMIKGEYVQYINEILSDLTGMDRHIELKDYDIFIADENQYITIILRFKKERNKKGGGMMYRFDKNGKLLEREFYK